MNNNPSATQMECQPARKQWPALLRQSMVGVAIAVVVFFGLRWYTALADAAPSRGNKKAESEAAPAKADKAAKGERKDEAVPPNKAEPKDPTQEALGSMMELMQEMLKSVSKPGGPGPGDLEGIMQKALQKAVQLQNLPGFQGAPGQANPLPQQGGGAVFPEFPQMPGFPQFPFPQGGFPGGGPGFRGMFPGFPGGLQPFGGLAPGWRIGGQPAKFGGARGNAPANINVQHEFNVTRQEDGESINVQGTVNNGAVAVKSITITSGGMTQQYQNLNQVPEAQRAAVNSIIEQQSKATQIRLP
jgi:hypothetical protein